MNQKKQKIYRVIALGLALLMAAGAVTGILLALL